MAIYLLLVFVHLLHNSIVFPRHLLLDLSHLPGQGLLKPVIFRFAFNLCLQHNNCNIEVLFWVFFQNAVLIKFIAAGDDGLEASVIDLSVRVRDDSNEEVQRQDDLNEQECQINSPDQGDH